MSDEVDNQGGEEVSNGDVAEVTNSDSAAVEAVGSKMAEIFGQHDAQDQADELDQSGVTGPDNPEGHDEEPTDATDAKADDSVEQEDAELTDLEAAEKEAAQSGDYERAMEIRDQIKEVKATKEAAASQASQDNAAKLPKGFDPTLAAVARDLGGWAEKDINDFVAANPTLARITFQRIADSYNAVSMQYAQAARNGVAPLTQQPVQNASPQQQQQTATLESLYKDLDNFAQVAGSEVVDRFIKPLKSEVLEPLKDVIAFVNEQRATSVRREVMDGFAAIAKDSFKDFYGDKDTLSDAQRQNRQAVAQVADQIHAGAQVQRVGMSYGEAIRRAHLIVNADKMQQQARTSLLQSAKKRSTQITSRPSNRIRKVTSVGDAAATQAVESFWENRE